MAFRDIKEKVLEMRRAGMSYSQIRAEVKVSKGTLSRWLKDLPLSKERILDLGARNQRRIENCRNTKAKKKQARLDNVYNEIVEDIGKLSKREVILSGIFLYWGEGTKTSEAVTALTNTNPGMIKFFINWFGVLGIEKSILKFRLQLYADMDIHKETLFWSNYLNVPVSQFSKPHLKKSNLIGRTYKVGFGHGTCTVSYNSVETYMYIKSALLYVQKLSQET